MYFVLGGESSQGFIKIKKNGINYLSSPEKSYESKVVQGRNGEIFNDNGGYKNFILEIDCYIDARKSNIVGVSRYLKRWLQSDLKYRKLSLSCESDVYYEAVCINKLDIEKLFNNFGECVLRFSCKPFKKLVANNVITVTENNTILNNEYYDSLPKLKIFGSGDMSITINNQKVSLKKVQNEIEIDSEEMECYVMKNSLISYQNNKMQGEFQVLQSGENKISWIGNITKIEIEPRWAVL